VGLSLIALAGIATLVSAIPLTRALGFNATNNSEDDDDDDDSISRTTIVMAFLGFAAADICFDCLLIPGRSLLHDNSSSSSSSSDELFTGFQLGGKLLALLVGSSSTWKLGHSADAHFDACFAGAAVFLMGSVIAVLCFVDDRGSTYTILSESGSSDPTMNSCGAMDVETKQKSCVCGDEHREILASSSSSPRSILIYNENESQTDNKTGDEIMSSPSTYSYKPDASVLLCTVQAMGWLSILGQAFFWTSWRGEEVGCTDLVLSSVVGMATAGLLPLANARFGSASVWCGSELSFHLLMICTGWVSSSGSAPRVIGALSGVNYAVHATNGLIVATGIISDPRRRAQTIAMVNNTLPMAQLITALSGGAIAQYFGGGFESVFVCYGFLGALVTSVVWAISSRHGLFPRNI